MGKKSISEADNSMVSEGDAENGLSYEDKLNFVSIIAKPMASKKLSKKLYKVIKKGKCSHDLFLYRAFKPVSTKLVFFVFGTCPYLL